MKQIHFKARWGAPLILMTLLATAMLVLVPVGCWMMLDKIGDFARSTKAAPPELLKFAMLLMVFAPVVSVLICAFYMVRGYVVTDDSVIVLRLGWGTPLNLRRLISAEVDPEALKKSMRIFGNSGLFAFTGIYRNQKLGVFRVYATDASRAVVLRFSDRTVVVTPDDPQKFVAEVKPLGVSS